MTSKIPKLVRDVGQALSGRIAASLLRLGMTVLLARVLTPTRYGLIALLLNGGLLLSSILEMGLGAAFIERESKESRGEVVRDRFTTLVRGRFWLWLGFLLVTTTVLLWPLPARKMVLAFVLFGTGQNLCVSFQIVYQVRQDFAGYARISLLFAGVQVLWSALLLLVFRAFDLPFDFFFWSMAVLGWVPLVALLRHSGVSLQQLLRRNWRSDFAYLRELFRFGKWVGLTTILTQGFSRYAVFLLGAAQALAEAGRYDIAMTVGRSVNNIVISTTAVLYPRFALQRQKDSVRRSVYQVLRIAGTAVAIGLAAYYLIGRWLVLWLFGPNYRASVTYLDILIPGLLLPILLEPVVGVVTFSMSRPRVITAVRLAKLGLFVGLGSWVLNNFQVKGLAGLQTILGVAETAAILAFAFHWLRASRRSGTHPG